MSHSRFSDNLGPQGSPFMHLNNGHLSELHHIPKHLTFLNYRNICAFMRSILYSYGLHHMQKHLALLFYLNYLFYYIFHSIFIYFYLLIFYSNAFFIFIFTFYFTYFYGIHEMLTDYTYDVLWNILGYSHI